MSTISSSIQLFLAAFGVIAFVVGGVFGLINLLDSNRKQRLRESDEIDGRVISGLKHEMELQKGQIDRMGKELREIRDINTKLIQENKTLREILQGRNKENLEYQAEGLKAMVRIEEMHGHMERLVSAIERLVANTTSPVLSEVHTSITTQPKGA